MNKGQMPWFQAANALNPMSEENMHKKTIIGRSAKTILFGAPHCL
jgi:hypothetical protein